MNHDNDAFYASARWKKKRAAILKRDKYQCQICKRYGKLKEAVIVHHIRELSSFPELAFTDSNLQSVCLSCHNRLHSEKAEAMKSTDHRRRY